MLTKSSWKETSTCRDVTQGHERRPNPGNDLMTRSEKPTFDSLYIYMFRPSKQCFPRLRLERAVVPSGTFLCLWDITAWFMKQPANYLTIKWVGCVTYVRRRGDGTFLTRRDVWEVLYELSTAQTKISTPDWMIKSLGQDTWHWASISLSLSSCFSLTLIVWLPYGSTWFDALDICLYVHPNHQYVSSQVQLIHLWLYRVAVSSSGEYKKVYTQVWKALSLTRVCVRMCIFRPSFLLNALSQ